MPLKQPSTKIKLTNVSIVRLKKGGNRFEIACYKNKVQEWRSGIETNLDDVLQMGAVYKNASKGDQAKDNDLKKAFGTIDKEIIVKEILKDGELQVGDKEREHELQIRRLEIVNIIAQKIINPDTKTSYSSAIINNALNEIGFSIDLSKDVNSKKVALHYIKELQAKSSLRIQRAPMRVRVVLPATVDEEARERIRKLADVVEADKVQEGTWEATLLIEPSEYRVIEDLMKKDLKAGDVSVLDHTVMATAPTPDA